MKSKYFYNLNGIRFVLAVTVIVCHVEFFINWLHRGKAYEDVKSIHAIANVSVSLFFTLSGFLIAYFLFMEKKEKEAINIKSFYIARVRRIFPLYYFTVFLYWIVMPLSPLNLIADPVVNTQYIVVSNPVILPKVFYLLLNIILLPQLSFVLKYILEGTSVYAPHIWSIGVEELFYLFFPLLLQRTTVYKKLFLRLMILYYIILISIIFSGILNDKLFHIPQFSRLCTIGAHFFIYTRFNCMIIGAIGAYAYIYKPELVQKYCNKPAFIISISLFLIMYYFGLDIPVLIHEIYCTLFVIIILYYSIDNKKNILLENKAMIYLGKITFGIYMYHFIVIIATVYFLEKLNIKSDLLYRILLYLGTFIFTIFTSFLSYEYYEKPILKKKSG